MLTWARRLLRPVLGETETETAARAVYLALVAQARERAFYTTLRVPDTVDGRFDMIVLHAFLVVARIRGEGSDAKDFGRALMTHLFADMDHNLREMGAGDMGVGRRVKAMAEAFYGRAGAYETALREGGDALAAALTRNVYPGVAASGTAAAALAAYVRRQGEHLAGQPLAAILAGNIAFVPPEAP